MFSLEGTWLGLYPRDSLAEDATVPGSGSGFPGFALAHNVASKALVDKTFAMVVEAGARPVKAPQDVYWGGSPVTLPIQMVSCGRSLGIRSRI
jgi:uncharacterized protein